MKKMIVALLVMSSASAFAGQIYSFSDANGVKSTLSMPMKIDDCKNDPKSIADLIGNGSGIKLTVCTSSNATEGFIATVYTTESGAINGGVIYTGKAYAEQIGYFKVGGSPKFENPDPVMTDNNPCSQSQASMLLDGKSYCLKTKP